MIKPVFVIFFVFFTVPVTAEIPPIISYQGRVTDSGGSPVTDGMYSMRFRIFNAATGGDLRWDSGVQSVEVNGGVFNVLLGESPMAEFILPFDEDYWMVVTFEGINQTPRQRLSSCGYAYMASGLVPGTLISESISGLPYGVLKVHNTATTGETYAITARHDSPSGTGIIATAAASSGETYGISAWNYSNQGTGIYGYVCANSGYTYGVYGRSDSPTGTAVYGWASATTGSNLGVSGISSSTSGIGVYGSNTQTSGSTYGVYGKSSSPDGEAVFGWAIATTGNARGVSGRSSSDSGDGVYGLASAASGVTCGGCFETYSTQGSGVRGIANATTGITYGVYGRSYSTSDDSRGVYGRSFATAGVTYGVYGRTDSNNDNATGVFGYSTATGGITYGVYGLNDSWYGTGVQGYAPLMGVWGVATGGASGSGTGVRGEGPLCGGSFDDTNSSSSAAVASDTYKIVGSGSVSFMQNHPYLKDRVIVYAAPEGDEVATYTRGTARLTDGEARVPLGETFKWVTNPSIGLTAHLTPRGRCEGLYVESLTTNELVVREQRDGHSDVAFDYIVYGLRIGFEEQTIVQEKNKEAYIPSMKSHRERCNRNPDLRAYTAFERFKVMRDNFGLNETAAPGEASALRDAIQEYDPSLHGPVGKGAQGIRHPHDEEDSQSRK